MTNKLLLAAIALGLFANAAATLVRPVKADDRGMLLSIADDVHALAMGGSGCRNRKICD